MSSQCPPEGRRDAPCVDRNVLHFTVSPSHTTSQRCCPVIVLPLPLPLKFISLQLVWTKCESQALICKQELVICQGITDHRYPSLDMSVSLVSFSRDFISRKKKENGQSETGSRKRGNDGGTNGLSETGNQKRTLGNT